MTVYARYDGPRTRDYIEPGRLYRVTEDGGDGVFRIMNTDGGEDICRWEGCSHLNGGNWTRVEIPDEPNRMRPRINLTWEDVEPDTKWFVVPDYKPDATPATSATVVDRAGQQVAHFERIADAEIAVGAVNGD